MRAPDTILPLRLSGVSFRVDGQTLLDGIDLTLSAGPRTIVLGPNGAGKSLLLRICHGLLEASSGTVEWSRPNAGRRQAMVFQRPVLLRRSAAANIEYALAVKGVPRADRRDRAAEALRRTGLTHRADVQARSLSFGEQQRLALARAWATEPEVLFLDEPTANLDPAATHAVEQIVQAIHAAGTRIVMTTHDLAQARRMADDVVFLHKGRLVEAGPAEAFFENPASEEAKRFLAGELLWD